MKTIELEGIGAVQETLIIPLAMRAMDARSQHSILNDIAACNIYKQISYNKNKFKAKRGPSYWGCLKRTEYIDNATAQHISLAHEAGKPCVVINAGCGLDTRRQRLGSRLCHATFYNVDFPEVMAIRKELIREDDSTNIGCSLLEKHWIDEVLKTTPTDAKIIIAIEGVLMYLEREKIETFLQMIHTAFGGRCTLIFDMLGSAWAKRSNLHDTIRKMEANFVSGFDSTGQIRELLPALHFENFVSIPRLMGEVWWPAKCFCIFPSFRNSSRIYTFSL